MSESSTYQSITKKAFEISYAVFRVTAHMKNKKFASHLQDYALELLSSSSVQDFEKAQPALKTVEYLVRLGVELDFISLRNGQVLVGEMGTLEAHIKEQEMKTMVNLQTDFAPALPLPQIPTTQDERKTSVHTPSGNTAFANGNNDATQGKTNPDVPKTKDVSMIRQTAIANMIRQSKSCRLQDIQRSLPDVSERTLRYDIQKLIDQGLVERVGGGGPFSYYRAKAVSLPTLSTTSLSL